MSIFRSSFFFSAGTLISRLFGLLREAIVAGVFGATSSMDAFLVANRIPNLLRELLAEGALGSSFTKVFTELKERDEKRSLSLLTNMLALSSLVCLIICILAYFLAPYLVEGLTLLREDERSQFTRETVALTRILFPFIALMSLGAVLSGVLHQAGRFGLSSISSVGLNLGYIIGALFITPLLLRLIPERETFFGSSPAIAGLALGVLLGGLLQLSLPFFFVWKNFLRIKPWQKVSLWNEDIKQVILLMSPMIIASSAGQINILINTNFATSLQEGAVTWLNFSFRLLQLPIGLFAVAVSTVSLPALSRLRQRKDSDELSAKLMQSLELVLWLLTPCLFFFLTCSKELISLIYEHGKMSALAAEKTAEALWFYSLGLIAYGLIKVLTSFFYVLKKTSFAMRVSLFGIFINLLANSFFVERLGHKGLALATSLVMIFNAFILLLGLLREKNLIHIKKLLASTCLLILSFSLNFFLQSLIKKDLLNLSQSLVANMKVQKMIYLLGQGSLTVFVFSLAFYWSFRKKA